MNPESKGLSPTNPDDLIKFVFHFTDRLYLLFAYPFFLHQFQRESAILQNPSPVSEKAIRLATIGKACAWTSLMALRDIDDVLAPQSHKSWPDDLKAHSFGYPGGSFLTPGERDVINKVVVHSTTFAVNSQGRLSLDGKNVLDVGELMWKGIAQGTGFLEMGDG